MIENRLHISEQVGSPLLHKGKIKEFLIEIFHSLSHDADAERAAFWLYRKDIPEFEGISFFDSYGNNVTKAKPLTVPNYLPFIRNLGEKMVFTIHTDSSESHFKEFQQDFINANKKITWILVKVLHEGKLFGLLGIQREGTIILNQFEELIMITSASLISQCYDSLLRKKESEVRKREFDRLVEERIDEQKEILIRKLTDHAFYTSHHIRHPLTTILALVDLIKISWEDRENYEAYIRQLKIESMNLDEAIRVMTAKIELD